MTAVIPYLAYARKDARTQPHDPLGTQLLARLLEAAGCDQVMVFEPHHAGACENAYRVPVLTIDAAPAFDAAVRALAGGRAESAVDAGAGADARAGAGAVAGAGACAGAGAQRRAGL